MGLIMRQSIECKTLEEFLDCVQGLTMRGLTFNANSSTLIIELTGGF